MQAHCILEILPSSASPQSSLGGLNAETAAAFNVTVAPGKALVPQLLNQVWEGVGQHASNSEG